MLSSILDPQPLRDVLREVEQDDRFNVEGRNDKRLASELRAVAPLLRKLQVVCKTIEDTGYMCKDCTALRDKARALADELEAK